MQRGGLGAQRGLFFLALTSTVISFFPSKLKNFQEWCGLWRTLIPRSEVSTLDYTGAAVYVLVSRCLTGLSLLTNIVGSPRLRATPPPICGLGEQDWQQERVSQRVYQVAEGGLPSTPGRKRGPLRDPRTGAGGLEEDGGLPCGPVT